MSVARHDLAILELDDVVAVHLRRADQGELEGLLRYRHRVPLLAHRRPRYLNEGKRAGEKREVVAPALPVDEAKFLGERGAGRGAGDQVERPLLTLGDRLAV